MSSTDGAYKSGFYNVHFSLNHHESTFQTCLRHSNNLAGVQVLFHMSAGRALTDSGGAALTSKASMSSVNPYHSALLLWHAHLKEELVPI